MTRDANDTQDHNAPTTASDDAIAAAVQTQLSLVASFDRWLARKTDAGRAANGILSRVQRRLDTYRRWLLEHEQTPGTLSEEVDSWDMNAHVQSGNDDGSVVTVTGPGLGEPIEIAAKDEKELRYLMSDNYLGYMIKICRAFSKAQDTMRSLLKTASEVAEERSHLSQPPETTVKTYIRGLQEYNEIKDIGQQLIGLIAENRGVPIRTLYESGEYGVSIPP